MISMLNGRVDEISANIIVLDVAGVGYEVVCSSGCLKHARLGCELRLVTYTDVKQDSIKLYGFEDQLERRVFVLLTKVKGLGAKSASDLLSKIDKRDLLRIIGAGDIERLLRIKGIGRKTAERILVELRDKVVEHAIEMQVDLLRVDKEVVEPYMEAIEALQALGFLRREAERAVKLAEGQFGPGKAQAAEVVKQALKFI